MKETFVKNKISREKEKEESVECFHKKELKMRERERVQGFIKRTYVYYYKNLEKMLRKKESRVCKKSRWSFPFLNNGKMNG